MKRVNQNTLLKKALSFEKFKVAAIGNPEKINGGDGGWTRVKDKDNCERNE